ncbi:hypothetical protein [Acinetobacter indicus]|uniref:hypothetical protein n=1 Tax=Acinetobacter indicus TaxID=756892 RepID=UPI0009489A05|nr:hypothetical protein [Acinetobacter indicus]
MKYLLVGILAVIIGAFYFMHQSNKESMARIEASQQAYTEQQNKTVKVAELQKSLPDLRESDALKLIESPKMSNDDVAFYKDLSGRWFDALKVADATPRIDLSGPVQELQKLKRDLDARQPKTDCEDMMRAELLSAYNHTIDGFLEFMLKNESRSDANTRIALDSMDAATFMLNYCKAT